MPPLFSNIRLISFFQFSTDYFPSLTALSLSLSLSHTHHNPFPLPPLLYRQNITKYADPTIEELTNGIDITLFIADHCIIKLFGPMKMEKGKNCGQ
jgi:hypothetical protein